MTRKMNYGIKISKRDFNVLDLDQKNQTKKEKREIAHILTLLALPYVLGAKAQVERYKLVARILESNPKLGTLGCLHEISNLFEDLNSVLIYLRKCNIDHKDHTTWEDIRNHLRHSIREEFDKDDELKEARSKRLGLDPRLQVNIGFDLDAVKLGETVIELGRVINYLEWAEKKINLILNEAQQSGKVS